MEPEPSAPTVRSHNLRCMLASTLGGLCLCGILAMFPVSTVASPLTKTSFNNLATTCAPAAELRTLRAVAAVESHFEPWAVRDNTTHETWTPPSKAAAAILADERLKKGHSVDLGLMQINSANLASLGMGASDALDPCRSLNAAQHILLAGFAAGSSEAERQAAILITLSRYNTGRPLSGIANGYVNRVITAQNVSPTGKLAQTEGPNIPPQWDVWGASGAEPSSWVVTATVPSEIEGAGSHLPAAHSTESAAGPLFHKGEPYELSAYHESESPHP
jgi:type IV secretion system protein VirB1